MKHSKSHNFLIEKPIHHLYTKTTLLFALLLGLFLNLLLSSDTFGQTGSDSPEKKVKSTIESATVFLKGGNIQRKALTPITKGKQTIVFIGLSAYLEKSTIRVKGKGSFTILNISNRINYDAVKAKDKRVESLEKKLNAINDTYNIKQNRLNVLNEKQSLLQANKNLNGKDRSATLTQMKAALDFYDLQLTALFKDRVNVQNELNEIEKKRSVIRKQIKAEEDKNNLTRSEIIVELDAPKSETAKFEISYFTNNVGWFPKYDVRAKTINDPIKIAYKASLSQNTGIDWNNINLSFSSAEPNKSNTPPNLDSWFLSYGYRNTNPAANYKPVQTGQLTGIVFDASDNTPLPGVNISYENSSVGTTTDFDGRFAMVRQSNKRIVLDYFDYQNQVLYPNPNGQYYLHPEIQELNEVYEIADEETESKRSRKHKGRASTNVLRNSVAKKEAAPLLLTAQTAKQTAVEFKVVKPYTAKSRNQPYIIDINTYETKGQFQYFAVPKLDKTAYLTTEITDYNKLNIIEGEANLYFEDSFVGKTVLGNNNFSDTLSISLGRDKGIIIKREKQETLQSKKFIGSNKIDKRAYKIIVRNTKSVAVDIVLQDQIPIATNSTMEIETLNISGGKSVNGKTGVYEWKLNLKPNETKELIISYQVKYPKKQRLVLD